MKKLKTLLIIEVVYKIHVNFEKKKNCDIKNTANIVENVITNTTKMKFS